jgi:BirA family biotin operon repressor/biotin-[acetyl-CoA-carboxylase] ligase
VEFNQQRFEAAYQVVKLCSPGNLSVPIAALHVFETVPSTNQTAWKLLEQGAPVGTVVIALTQTAGRGQWGRQWSSPAGGLYLSATLNPDLPVEHSAQLTLCTAWGIAKALREIPGQLSGIDTQIPMQVKWPNDLVLKGRKLGGILTETRVRQERITRAVVGVGINWTNLVPETGINLKSYLEDLETPLVESLEMLTAITLNGLLTGYSAWQQQGIDALLPAYLELLAGRDRPITLDGQSAKIIGVTATGELRVRLQALDPNVTRASQTTFAPSAVEVLIKPGTISLGYGA